MQRLRPACACLFLAAVLAMAGCTESIPEVSGKVTVDGQPIESGSIAFYPVDGSTKTSGEDIRGGLYSAKVPIGKMKVQISMPKAIGKKKLYDKPDSPEYPVNVEGLPAKYNLESELTLDVKPGKNQKDWELTTK